MTSKNTFRNLIAKTSFFLITFLLLSGCQFYIDGKKKLNLYCPGLKVNISGVSWSGDASKDVYVLSYDRDFQKKIQSYFKKKENGFTEVKNGDFYDIVINDNKVIDRKDQVVVKTIEKSKGTAEVIFNETTRKIIIIEE
jgi:hypothetical protein